MIIIGVDESGSGAWAGDVSACALAIEEEYQDVFLRMGVRDSKTLSDTYRRQLVIPITSHAIIGCVELASPEEIDRTGLNAAWARIMFDAITYVAARVGEYRVVIDGNPSNLLTDRLRKAKISPFSFMVKADTKVPVVSAASILAKTVRNDRMRELHREFPEYRWISNSGYGTRDHILALSRHGKSPHHRSVKPLRGIRDREP